MEKDKDILKQVGRDTGMRVPDGYFESFTSRMVSQLDNFEVVEPEKPTVCNVSDLGYIWRQCLPE